jgi:hypothetical protein
MVLSIDSSFAWLLYHTRDNLHGLLAEPVDICAVDEEGETGGGEDFNVGKRSSVGIAGVDGQNLEGGTDRKDEVGVCGWGIGGVEVGRLIKVGLGLICQEAGIVDTAEEDLGCLLDGKVGDAGLLDGGDVHLTSFAPLFYPSFRKLHGSLAGDPDQGKSLDPLRIFEKDGTPVQIIIVRLIESPVPGLEAGREDLVGQVSTLVSSDGERVVVPIENGLSSDLSKHFVSHLSSLPD